MFVSYDEWRRLDIFHPDDAYMDFKEPRWYEYYRHKYYYASISKAKDILEIGVRLGYAAFAFMSSPYCESYTGWDIQEPIDGGMKFPTFDWVREKVTIKFRNVKASLEKKDSLKDEWGSIKFDLIHIDGDHSYSGVISDCKKAYDHIRIGGLIVVDDYTFLKDVKRGVDEFLDENDIPRIISFSLRGDALIWKTEGGSE